MFKASDCGRLGRQAADHPWSALCVVKSCRKECPTAKVLLEAKAPALHPKRYQTPLSKLSTKGSGRGGEKKRKQSDWPANQIDKEVIDRLKTDTEPFRGQHIVPTSVAANAHCMQGCFRGRQQVIVGGSR